MTLALYILGGILLVYIGYILGIIHASIVALKERETDKKNLDEMTETTAKMLILIEKLLKENNNDDKTN